MMLPDVSFRCYTAAAYVTQVGALWMRWEMTGIKRDNRTLPETVASCSLMSISIIQKIYFLSLALNIKF